MALFNGYESRSDDDYFSNSDQENNKKWLDKLIEGIPFERQMGSEIKFFVGQTFGTQGGNERHFQGVCHYGRCDLR